MEPTPTVVVQAPHANTTVNGVPVGVVGALPFILVNKPEPPVAAKVPEELVPIAIRVYTLLTPVPVCS